MKAKGRLKFQNGECYHIFNRGVDKRDVFMEDRDFLRFLKSIKEFNVLEPIGSLYRLEELRKKKTSDVVGRHRMSQTPLVRIIVYCLNPNHYHLILKQSVEGGISEFMKRLGDGYTKYFNHKYDRSGALFQGKFKAIHIDTNEYLLWLSGYVNGNAEIHKIAKAKNWKWCSYLDYFRKKEEGLCSKSKKIILDQFDDIKQYEKSIEIAIKEISRRKEEMKKYLLE